MQARDGDGEQFAKRVRLSMELPAYREERSWPARHMQTEGHAAVLSRAAGVCGLVWMVDVTRGAWLKIGDAPPQAPGLLSRPQTCPFALGSVRHCVLRKGEKGG